MFIFKCQKGEENDVKILVGNDPDIINRQDIVGRTGLMFSLGYNHFALSKWLLGLPWLKSDMKTDLSFTALHYAFFPATPTPLEIVILITKLSNWETVNMKDIDGDTALDLASQDGKTSAMLYLSWLGVECREENRRYREVTLHTWIEAGCQQEAQFWAVAANNVEALKMLSRMENVTLDRKKLRSLAKLLNQRNVWSHVTSLASLAWETVQQSTPALAGLSADTLLEEEVPNHVVRVILNSREEFKFFENEIWSDRILPDETFVENEE